MHLENTLHIKDQKPAKPSFLVNSRFTIPRTEELSRPGKQPSTEHKQTGRSKAQRLKDRAQAMGGQRHAAAAMSSPQCPSTVWC